MMVGEDLSSTDLHLANGDTLLVGQVAEVEQVDSLDTSATNRPYYRKLQVRNEGESSKFMYNLCGELFSLEPVDGKCTESVMPERK